MHFYCSVASVSKPFRCSIDSNKLLCSRVQTRTSQITYIQLTFHLRARPNVSGANAHHVDIAMITFSTDSEKFAAKAKGKTEQSGKKKITASFLQCSTERMLCDTVPAIRQPTERDQSMHTTHIRTALIWAKPLPTSLSADIRRVFFAYQPQIFVYC